MTTLILLLLAMPTNAMLVYRADDVRIKADVQKFLGTRYREMQPYLGYVTYIDVPKQIHTFGGMIRASEGRNVIVFSEGFAVGPGAKLFLPRFGMIESADGITPEMVKEIFPSPSPDGPISPGPVIDFILFSDGTTWGADSQRFGDGLRNRKKFIAGLMAEISEMNDEEGASHMASILQSLGPDRKLERDTVLSVLQDFKGKGGSLVDALVNFSRIKSPLREE